jgi:hypothetical protein
MRIVLLPLVAGVLSSAGCTGLVISSGTDLGALPTREEVRAKFGTPVASGTEEGKQYEDFRTRRKIAEPDKMIYLLMGYAYTFGLGEVVWFPHQSFVAARRSIVGQDLRFYFDEAGNVTAARHDGGWVTGVPRTRPATPQPAPDSSVIPTAGQ